MKYGSVAAAAVLVMAGLLVWGAVALRPLGPPPVPSAAAQTPTPSGITVIGQGQARGQPDIAYITAAIETTKATALEAQKETAARMNTVLEKLKALGVAEKDLRTSGLSLYPVYDKPGTITGYRATNEVRITVQEIARSGELMDAAVQAGANRGGQIRMGFKDDSQMRLEALDLAVKDALQKAEAIAKAMGAHIVGVEAVSEDYEMGLGPREALGMADGMGQGTPVQPGELTITARVRAVYRFQ